MKRYVIHVSAYVTVEAENVAQAVKLARKCKLIGAQSGARRSLKERDMVPYKIKHGELRFSRPIRLQSKAPADPSP